MFPTIEAHGPPERVRASGHIWNLRAYVEATPEERESDVEAIHSSAAHARYHTKSFSDMRPPGYWSRGRWVDVQNG